VPHRLTLGGPLVPPSLAPNAGFPSVGKSSLLTELTGTNSEAAAYEFTTLTCIPGVIHYNDAKIQLLDLPGIIEGAAQGKGRGRQVGVHAAAHTSSCSTRLFDSFVQQLLVHGRVLRIRHHSSGSMILFARHLVELHVCPRTPCAVCAVCFAAVLC
jgi:hypothetical protein